MNYFFFLFSMSLICVLAFSIFFSLLSLGSVPSFTSFFRSRLFFFFPIVDICQNKLSEIIFPYSVGFVAVSFILTYQNIFFLI